MTHNALRLLKSYLNIDFSLTVAYVDGLDNDGDGLIDANDDLIVKSTGHR